MLRQKVKGAYFGWAPAPLIRMTHPDLVMPAMRITKARDLQRYHGTTRHYLIASMPRTGSTLLNRLLEQTGSFGLPLEYLHPEYRWFMHRRFGGDRVVDYVDRLKSVRSTQNGWFGVNAHWPHFFDQRDELYFNTSPGFEAAVWLYRADILSQAISLKIARDTQSWEASATASGEPEYAYDALVEDARRLQNGNQGWSEWFSRPGAPRCLVYSYEEFTQNLAENFAEICRLIDPEISVVPPEEAPIKKQRNALNAEWKDRFRADVKDEDAWILEPQAWSLDQGAPK